MTTPVGAIGIGLVGFGYWGPNLARNFIAQPGCSLEVICEPDPRRQIAARQLYPHANVTAVFDELLQNPAVLAVLIATPVSTHFELARRALQAGKDVLVEKPLALSVAEAETLVDLADQAQRILAVDHTFLFTGAVRKIKQIVSSGALGEIMYIDSVRVNLGLFQHDTNVIYDLAPHDLSIMAHLIDSDPLSVRAMGTSHTDNDVESLAYLHLEFRGNLVAHIHVNWMAPVKVRRMLICGTRQMIVYDDTEPSEKVLVYDRGIVVKEGDVDSLYRAIVDYRTGDMVAPKLVHREALNVEAEHFLACVRDRSRPLSDGIAGLRVVRILQAAQTSLKAGGKRIALGRS